MASAVSAVSLVRCPKCLRVLDELPDVPLFNCYGCDAILKVEVHSDICSSENGFAVYVKQISTASDEPKMSGDSMSNGEEKIKELESSDNVSESNGSDEEKIESAVYELNGIIERSLDQDKVKPSRQYAHSLNQKVPEAIDDLNSSYELEEQSPESLEHDAKNEEGNEEDGNGIRFGWKSRDSRVCDRSFSLSRRSRSSHGCDPGFSSCNEDRQDHFPQKNIALSRRTRSRKVLDSAESMEAAGTEHVMKNSEDYTSENNDLSLISQSKDDRSNILEKVDELKIKLHRMFRNKFDGEEEASSFSIKVTRFEGKIESNDNRSSIYRFSRQPSSSCLLYRSAGRLCNETQLRHCRPVSGGAPFVICYKCYRLLQIPVDFLVSTKRVHKLRCGSCAEVLVYSFRPRSRAAVNKRS